MPLSRGRGKEAVSSNIAELMRSWKKTGKIGNNNPATVKDAQKMAAAIAHDRQRKGK